MTSLPTLLFSFAIVGAILSVLTIRAKLHKNILWTFMQHFCGVWFVFSGLVKAVDPIGTAYKMEDYFAAFEQTFEGLNNVFKGLAPMFPFLAKSALGFSMVMIVLEIALGLMLILGYRRKLTAWLFFTIVIFFTALTGFTYLTGFVPTDANFFDFAKWGPYLKSQMRVTDCGCFGDFILLDPKISFFKDLFLLIPAFMFLFRSKWMHILFSERTRNLAVWGTVLISTVFSYQNAYLNLPVVDFRPFKVGTNVREKKKMEAEARANVQILGYKITNTNTGQTLTFMEPDPAKPYSVYKNYPKTDGWKVVDQIKDEPYLMINGKKTPVKETKVSNFSLEDPVNGEVTEEILNEKGYSLMIVAYKFYGQRQMETITVQDTTWATDTIRVNKDSVSYQLRVAGINPKQVQQEVFVPEKHYAEYFTQKINPLAEAAQKAGWKTYATVTFQDGDNLADFIRQLNIGYPVYKGDDKLLKTIIRGNPGLVIWKDGQVVGMYHHRHLPDWAKLSAKYQ